MLSSTEQWGKCYAFCAHTRRTWSLPRLRLSKFFVFLPRKALTFSIFSNNIPMLSSLLLSGTKRIFAKFSRSIWFSPSDVRFSFFGGKKTWRDEGKALLQVCARKRTMLPKNNTTMCLKTFCFSKFLSHNHNATIVHTTDWYIFWCFSSSMSCTEKFARYLFFHELCLICNLVKETTNNNLCVYQQDIFFSSSSSSEMKKKKCGKCFIVYRFFVP